MIDIVNQPGTDQIWLASGCEDFEKKTLSHFKRIISKSHHLSIIDVVNHNYRDYKLVITDNVISNFEYQKLWPEFWGSFSYAPQYQNNIPTRLFNCFMNRTDPVRQSWFYQLVRRKLVDSGSVSFLLDYREPLEPIGFDVKNKAALYQWVFEQGCEIFAEEHNSMRSRVPFQNFSGDLDQTICNSKISLVLETYFDRPDVIAFSEKIFRALRLPRPFLLYCAPGAVAALKSQGFEVYDDIVNHGYDLEINNISRQVKILDELDKFKRIEYTDELLLEFKQRAERNRQLLRQLKADWPNKLKKVVEKIAEHK